MKLPSIDKKYNFKKSYFFLLVSDNDDQTAKIAGVSAGAGVFLISLGVGLFIWKKKKNFVGDQTEETESAEREEKHVASGSSQNGFENPAFNLKAADKREDSFHSQDDEMDTTNLDEVKHESEVDQESEVEVDTSNSVETKQEESATGYTLRENKLPEGAYKI